MCGGVQQLKAEAGYPFKPHHKADHRKSVLTFVRVRTEMEMSKPTPDDTYASAAIALANCEGLIGHVRSAQDRI